MPKLPPVSLFPTFNFQLSKFQLFFRRLQDLGFDGPFSGGKHPQMKRGTLTLVIPNEHEGDIGPGFLSRLLRQAGISRDEWLGED